MLGRRQPAHSGFCTVAPRTSGISTWSEAGGGACKLSDPASHLPGHRASAPGHSAPQPLRLAVIPTMGCVPRGHDPSRSQVPLL